MFSKLASSDQPSFDIRLSVDFKSRKFYKNVRCKNAVRFKDNTLANSSFDLVGRKVSFGNDLHIIEGRLTRIALSFPYDCGSSPSRFINIPDGADGAIVEPWHIGLRTDLVSSREKRGN